MEWDGGYLQFSLAFAISVYTFLTTSQSRGFISQPTRRTRRIPLSISLPVVCHPLSVILPESPCLCSPTVVLAISSCGLFSLLGCGDPLLPPCWHRICCYCCCWLWQNILCSSYSIRRSNNNHFIAIKPFILIEFNCVYTSLKPFGSCYCGWPKNYQIVLSDCRSVPLCLLH